MIHFQKIGFKYPQAELPILEGFDLNFLPEGLSVICGASGSGKTTLLKLLSGAHIPQQGSVFVAGHHLHPETELLVPYLSGIERVSQEFELFSYLTVAQNIGRNISNTDLNFKDGFIDDLLNITGLTEFKHRKVEHLSGGQRQRVAIAKALAKEPKILLLDEPFSQLDPALRWSLQEYLFGYGKSLGIKMILSTHDLSYSLPFCEELIIIKNGKVLHQNTPQHIFQHVEDEYTASFFGEFNRLSNEMKAILATEKNILFPNQLETAHEGLPAKRLRTEFAGQHYRCIFATEAGNLILYSESIPDEEVFLREKILLF